MSFSITWHGHGTFSLHIDGMSVVVDPYFAPNNPAASKGVDAVAADFVLQTHGHFDHITDTFELASRTGALVICNLEISNWLSAKGEVNTWAMNCGGGRDFDFGRVKMVPAWHSSGLPDGSYGGGPAGFVVSASGVNVYLAGDTALFSDMSLIGEIGLDLAILPVGDNFTMGPEDSLRAIEFLRPKVVVPGHYNTWPPIAIDVDAWSARVREETSAVPVVLGVEERYTI